ncbi:MAG: amidohydrolase family protein [Candidatus Pacebacteria bacterium]|nr:amidohydrolase family protein [Candidatus Paceibacterota bacterium]
MYDVIIKNGLVFDGLGNKPQAIDVAIKNSQIVGLGDFQKQKAKLEIDANKKFVSPGFIEINTLADRDCSVIRYPQAANFIVQGVTTVIGGASGASLAPIVSGSIDYLEKWVDSSKININWRSVAEFLEYLTQKQLGVNFGMLVSWAILRNDFTHREFRLLSREEKEKLKFLIKQSLLDGALGVAFGLGYEEEQVVSVEEILEIADVVKEHNGYLGFGLRNEAENFIASVQEVGEVATKGAIPVEIYQLKTLGEQNHLNFSEGLKIINEVNQDKELLNFDISPYNVASSPLLTLLPDWAAVGGRKVFLRNIQDEALKKKIIQDLKQKKYNYHNLIIAESQSIPWFIGKTLDQLASDFGLKEEEVILKILEIGGANIKVINQSVSEENTKEGFMSEYSLISSGAGFYEINDSYTHLSPPQAFGAFPRFLGEYVREKKIYSWEQAIYKLTGKPAFKIGLKNRGLIKKGYQADLVVFDPDKIEGRATFRNPWQLPVGIETVLINGVVALDKGRLNTIRAGEIVK